MGGAELKVFLHVLGAEEAEVDDFSEGVADLTEGPPCVPVVQFGPYRDFSDRFEATHDVGVRGGEHVKRVENVGTTEEVFDRAAFGERRRELRIRPGRHWIEHSLLMAFKFAIELAGVIFPRRGVCQGMIDPVRQGHPREKRGRIVQVTDRYGVFFAAKGGGKTKAGKNEESGSYCHEEAE